MSASLTSRITATRTTDTCLFVRWDHTVGVLVMISEQKVSQMILDVAAQFIELGNSEEERQTHLDIACKAWNISILPKSRRNKEYNKYLDEVRSRIQDKQIMEYFKEDLDGLIKAKLELYPNEKKPIISAKIENIDSNQYRVIAAFARDGVLH